MAMVIMGANIAGIYGAQIFRSDDKPRYRRAFVIGIAVLGTGALLAVGRLIDERIRGRTGKKVVEQDDSSEDERRRSSSLTGDLQPQLATVPRDALSGQVASAAERS